MPVTNRISVNHYLEQIKPYAEVLKSIDMALERSRERGLAR